MLNPMACCCDTWCSVRVRNSGGKRRDKGRKKSGQVDKTYSVNNRPRIKSSLTWISQAWQSCRRYVTGHALRSATLKLLAKAVYFMSALLGCDVYVLSVFTRSPVPLASGPFRVLTRLPLKSLGMARFLYFAVPNIFRGGAEQSSHENGVLGGKRRF